MRLLVAILSLMMLTIVSIPAQSVIDFNYEPITFSTNDVFVADYEESFGGYTTYSSFTGESITIDRVGSFRLEIGELDSFLDMTILTPNITNFDFNSGQIYLNEGSYDMEIYEYNIVDQFIDYSIDYGW